MLQPFYEHSGKVTAVTQLPPPRRSWRKLQRRIRRAAIVLIVPPLLGWLIFLAAVAWWPYPHGIDRAPTPATWIEDRNGEPLAAFVGADGQWQLPLDRLQISDYLIKAIIAVEDGRFHEHHGVDWRAATAAACGDLTSLHINRGASTITMQLQRLRDPRPRTFFNKFEQAVRACQIEKTASKDAIVTEYLNRAPFGGNLVGAGAASWRYFGRPCNELSLAQAALLAGLPQSPNRLRPDRFPEKAKRRRDHVLARMLACRMINSRQLDDAINEPVTATWRPLPQTQSPTEDAKPAPAGVAVYAGARIGAGSSLDPATASRYPSSGALPTLAALARRCPGQTIVTSLDTATQRQVSLITREHLAQLESSGVHAAAVVILDTTTSECLATITLSRHAAGLDLTARPRSTGSTLKPFIYAAAFDAGACTPGTVLNDAPGAWQGYLPRNYDREFRGRMTAAEALAESRNLPVMVVLGQVGVSRVLAVCEGLGLRTAARAPREMGLSLAIGGAECSPMELAGAYATLARGGIYKPVTLTRTEQISGEPHILRCAACLDVLRALSEPQRTARLSPEAAALSVAWKTGTSSGHRDAWCAAVTPRRTVVVWLGNVSGAGSTSLVGADAAAPLALRLIASLDRGGPAWPAAAAVAAASQVTPAHWRSSPLVIASPARGQEMLITHDLALDQQRVALRGMNSADSAATLWWFVDDEPVGSCTAGQPLWWSPSPGAHQARLVDSAGHSATVDFRVKTP